ncbi:hypothetical protein NBRC116601_04350 [Cognatishimia sp. WU-CL00825]
MKNFMLNKLRFFRKSEDGNAAVEFAIMFPVLLVFLMMSVEVGLMTLRHTMLERAMDDTVRWVRLNTGGAPTHEELKARICEYNVVPDCATNLHLEMVVRDVRNWTDLPSTFACTDASETIAPMSEYSFGMDNELVVLRACAKYTPIFPSSKFASALQTDGAGDTSITAMTAFVQEPR